MKRVTLLFVILGCAADDDLPASTSQPLLRLERRVLSGDVAEWSADVPVPDGRIRIHRVTRELAPFLARPTPHAVMFLHGDFSTFDTNFAEGLAAYLAGRGVDVWGFDRRWTFLPADTTDFSSLVGQGFDRSLADTDVALVVARALRAAGGAGAAPLVLGGFSRGAHLAFAFAVRDASRPPPLRQIRGFLPIDMFHVGPPEVHDAVCALAELDRAALALGPQADNTLFPLIAALAETAPDEESPIFPGLSNHDAFLALTTQTFLFYNPTPSYHLFAPGLAFTPEARALAWLAGAAPFQALQEVVDSETLWCDGGLAPLAAVRVPVLYVGAAGGFGDFGRPSIAALGSSDKTVLVVRLTGDDGTDVGHADLLFAADAPALAWGQMATWLRAH